MIIDLGTENYFEMLFFVLKKTPTKSRVKPNSTVSFLNTFSKPYTTSTNMQPSIKFFLLCFLSCLSLTIIAQPNAEWFTEHSGTSEESHGHYIMTCSDGGFLQIGETGFIPNSAKLLVVKTNAMGDLVWQKEFGSSGHNLGNSAIEVADGYLICGALNRNSTIIKLNKSNGSTIFNQSVNNGGADAFEHVAATATGLVAVGYRNALDDENTFFTEGQGYLSWLDANGNFQSGMNLNSYLAHAYRIQNFNGDLFISGLTEEALDYAMLKMNTSGTVLWNQVLGGANADHCFGMDMGSDGSIFLAGHTLSGTINWDTYTMKLDQEGNILWEQKRGNPRGFNPQYIHDEAWGVKATPDGGCIVVAGTGDEYGNYSECNGDDCSDTWHCYLIKYDANGNLDWQNTYSSNGEGDWAGEDIALTSDGGAIVGIDNGQFGFLKIAPFSTTLPTELSNFQAERVGEEAALLTWVTSSEVNVDYFIIERSMDTANWTAIDEVTATGIANTYTYTDKMAADNANVDLVVYYRLKIKDMDGKVEDGLIRPVYFTMTNVAIEVAFSKVRSYPNPIVNQVTITNLPTPASYKIVNSNGILLQEGVFLKGDNVMDISQLSTGLYFVLIKNKHGQKQLKWVKM